MLFSKAIIQAEWEANAPLREAMAIKRERLRALRAKRAAEQRLGRPLDGKTCLVVRPAKVVKTLVGPLGLGGPEPVSSRCLALLLLTSCFNLRRS
jgi:hypothetical protein